MGSFFLEDIFKRVKMFRVIFLVLAIAKSEENNEMSNLTKAFGRANHGETTLDYFWAILMAENRCLEMKWLLNNYENDVLEDLEGTSHGDLLEGCAWYCDAGKCHTHEAEDFVNDENCNRLLSGDLRDQFEKEVINSPESDDRTSMMAVMNIMCGNVTMDCAYAAQAHWDQVKGARNVFEDLAEAVETEEKQTCLEQCDGQMWNEGHNNFVEPCSSLMHSLSIAIILILSLIR